MYKFEESFKVANDRQQPYNIEVIRSSSLNHDHAKIYESGGYHIECSGNTYLFMTPSLTKPSIEIDFAYSERDFLNKDGMDEGIIPAIRVHIGYDVLTRTSYVVDIAACYTNTLYVQFTKMNGYYKTVIEEKEFDFVPDRDVIYKVNIDVKDSEVYVKVEDHEMSFAYTPVCGRIGVSRNPFPGTVGLHNVVITADEEFEEKTVAKIEDVMIPQDNGGDIPYTISAEIKQFGDTFALGCKLGGGCSTREKVARKCGYSQEKDYFVDAYVKILKKDGSSFKCYLKNGELNFIDPHYHWFFLITKYDYKSTPYFGACGLPAEFAKDDIMFVFGYKSMSATGYSEVGSNGAKEYVFDTNGNLLYGGDSLENEDIYSFTSPTPANITNLIPKDTPEYDRIMSHLGKNHYFTTSDNAEMTMTLMTKKEAKYITVDALLADVYDETIKEDIKVVKETKEDSFGFAVNTYSVDFGKLECNVYRAVFNIYDGDELLEHKSIAFEVLDPESDVAPPEAAGLPFLYSTPNEQAFLVHDRFDPWLNSPSNNVEHYYNCCAYTPDVAMNRQTWKAIKPFKRKWYMWFSSRTVFDWDPAKYADAVKNADFINHQFTKTLRRVDPLRITTYTPDLMNILYEFFDQNPEVEAQVGGMRDRKITYEELNKLFAICGEKWLRFVGKRVFEITSEDSEELRKYNPDFKRADYGSIPMYGSPYATYWQTKYFGRSYENQSKVYDGFMQLEDYPNSCAYQSYRGALCLATINLHDPDLHEHPELYGGGKKGGCADGLVAYANPPFGGRVQPAYYSATQAHEYLFNGARRTENGFEYWKNPGFMFRDPSVKSGEEFVKRWKYAVKNKPVKPMRSIAFVTDYIAADDRYEGDLPDRYSWANVHNLSEEGQGFLYGCARECGVPAGFFMKIDTLKTLSADETDVIVLPSLAEADSEVIAAVRKLYEQGVNLIAVSDIPGLEDIFGVKRADKKFEHKLLTIGDVTENVYPKNTAIKYEADGAEVLAHSEGNPILMRYNRTLILNMPLSDISIDTFFDRVQVGRECISKPFMALCKKQIEELSNPLIKGENCGVTAFTDENGNKMLMLIDYSLYHLNDYETPMEKVVKFNMDVKDIECERPVKKLYADGKLEGFKITMGMHESVFVKLID